MSSAICTLFENHYHVGLAALVNSLYINGFRGAVWAGYRGPLPPWAKPICDNGKYAEFAAAPGCVLRFLKLSTEAHLTNYKPDFLLQLWDDHCAEADSLFYFDPDIVVKCRWSFFQDWADCGVCLCEDVNSPFLNSHPVREAWRRYYAPHGFSFPFHTDVYVNAGFIGLRERDRRFLHAWRMAQQLMAPAIGGLQNVFLKDRTFLFHRTDQDALNVTVMTGTAEVSLIGREGMAFVPGGFTMAHAIGSPKPWEKSAIAEVLLRGRSPSAADRGFVQHMEQPIRLYSRLKTLWKRMDVKLAAGIGRVVGTN